MRNSGIGWPVDRKFAFTIFDDPDNQTLENGKPVYDLLRDLGLRTTKAVWPLAATQPGCSSHNTCENPDYLDWVLELQRSGFEIAYHMAAPRTSTRERTLAGLRRFADVFGRSPSAMANHWSCKENIYFGDARLSGCWKPLYNLLTRFQNRGRFQGHIQESPYFWGDACRQNVKYVRNFVFNDVNTLNACRFMPYHDPQRPFVNYWFAASEGADVAGFKRLLASANQDRLEAEGGACIVYTHFGRGFCKNGSLDAEFRRLMERLAKRNAWFVPVSELLDYLLQLRSDAAVSRNQVQELERRWLMHKIRVGTT